jgi:F-type H+-transporting ATPase subunit delta
MSELAGYTVRDIYCEVLFELAEESARIDTVMSDLSDVAAVLAGEPEFVRLLTSPAVTGPQKAEIVRRVFDGRVNELTLDFVCVLARRNRFRLLGLITDRYERLVDRHYGRKLVEVTLAATPSDSRIEKLNADIAEAVKSNVKLDIHIVPEIIGGIVIRTEDRIVDNSIRTALATAAQQVCKMELNL